MGILTRGFYAGGLRRWGVHIYIGKANKGIPLPSENRESMLLFVYQGVGCGGRCATSDNGSSVYKTA